MGDVVTLTTRAPGPREVFLARLVGGPAAGDHTLSSFEWAWPLPAYLEVPDSGNPTHPQRLGRYVKVSDEPQCPHLTDVLTGRARGPHTDTACGWCAAVTQRRGAQYEWQPSTVDGA